MRFKFVHDRKERVKKCCRIHRKTYKVTNIGAFMRLDLSSPSVVWTRAVINMGPAYLAMLRQFDDVFEGYKVGWQYTCIDGSTGEVKLILGAEMQDCCTCMTSV